MDLQFDNDFETFAKSGKYEDALQDKDFVKRAIKLFEVREKLWKTYDKSRNEISDAGEEKAHARARWPGRIAFGMTSALCTFGVLGLAGIVTVPLLLVAGGIGLAGGLLAGWGARSVAKSGPREDADLEIREMEKKRKSMHARIDTEIETMDSQLVNQSPQVRSEFREAFKHASVKEEARLNRIHRAKVEQEVEEAAEAAQTAAAMSTIAAVNSATAAMRR